MDLGSKNANNLISKNPAMAKEAAREIVDSKDIETFNKLCEKSEFIFDFIKEKINENLINAVNKENFSNIIEFTKIYSPDFENFIIKSWLKFANEDLTDEILALFEEGTQEQMAYAAAYFYHINDPVALEYLEKYAFSEYEPLAQNCAAALKQFDSKKLYNKAIEIIQSGQIDDFEKYKYVNFLTAYNDKNAYEILFNYLKNTYTKGLVSANILYLKSFRELAGENKLQDALQIFDYLLEAYPEEISLETVLDFEVFDFIQYLFKTFLQNSSKSSTDVPLSYIKRILLKAKYKFNLISREEIYTFDLGRNAKKEISNISQYINTIEIDLFENFDDELKSNDKERILESFDVILNFGKVNFSEIIAETIINTTFEDVISEGIKALKTFGKLNLIDKDRVLEKLHNENLKSLTESYFS